MNDNNSSNNGNRGRFSDRLKKMRKDRLKLNKSVSSSDDVEENIIKTGVRNVLKIFLVLPSIVYGVVKTNEKNKLPIKKEVTKGFDEHKKNVNNLSSIFSYSNVKKIKVNKIKDIENLNIKKKKTSYLRKNEENISKKNVNGFVSNEIKKGSNVDKAQKIKNLQKEIIDLIKKKMVKNINELEMLQSDLFVLRELNGDDIFLKECQEDIKEVKKLLSKIKSLKEKYDYLKNNVDFEYMLEYGDNTLVDKIVELKELCSSNDIKYVVDNYKILDEYKFLYLKIDKLQENTIKYDEYKRLKEQELKSRDIDFNKLKNNMYDLERENERYNKFVKEQELFLKDLERNVLNVDVRENVTYKLKGFNQLLGNSFKYLGLLLVNPLKGVLPGIATQTVVTKNLIHNLYNNLEWEESRKLVYEAIDYSVSINIAINNLDSTLSLVDTTLEDISRLKRKYEKNFSQYQHAVPGYKDAIKKINKMENAVMGSKIKIELMQERMKQKERQNSDKIKKIKKLNSSINK